MPVPDYQNEKCEYKKKKENKKKNRVNINEGIFER